MKSVPFTYLIGWSKLNKWYYGVRYAKNCHPDDLWTSYKTSSRIVSKFVLQHGDPDVREVRQTFNNIKSAQLWEAKVLHKMKVVKNSNWLNGHDSKAFDPSLVPKGDAHWTRQDTEAARNWQLKMRGDAHWTHQKTKAAEKHRDRMNGCQNPNNNLDNRLKSSKRVKEQNPVNIPGVKEKISLTLTGRKHPRKICEHCGKDIAQSIYSRYHGDKCRDKNK